MHNRLQCTFLYVKYPRGAAHAAEFLIGYTLSARKQTFELLKKKLA